MAKIELEPMADAELEELAAAVAQEQERRQEAAQQAAVARIHELAAGVGMTVEELLARQSKRRAGSKGEPKYRNPDHLASAVSSCPLRGTSGDRQGFCVGSTQRMLPW